MKTITLCVTSDLSTDQRILRHSKLLHDQGFKVVLVGRKRAESPPLPQLPFSCIRWRMIFTKGPFFYLFYNIRLFFFLLFKRTDIIWSNDLDTALPCAWISKLRKKRFVFDAHELFTEVPELENSRIKKSIWLWIERKCATKADFFITVNDSLAKVFASKYEVSPIVIRNVPNKFEIVPKRRAEYKIEKQALILIVQGSGLNLGRGLLESIQAIEKTSGIVLFVVGSGTAVPSAKSYVDTHKLHSKIQFIGRLPYHELINITAMADVGLAFDAHPCLNYHLALPNKIFDYFQAGIAVICAQQPEIKRLVVQYDCGVVMNDCSIEAIRSAVLQFKDNPIFLEKSKTQSKIAGTVEHWGEEKRKLLELINQIG